MESGISIGFLLFCFFLMIRFFSHSSLSFLLFFLGNCKKEPRREREEERV